MANPKVGTVRHVIINQPNHDQFYWVTWEQFVWERHQAEWATKASKFETYEEARKFSLSL